MVCTTYFVRAVSYTCKMFMKSMTGGNVITHFLSSTLKILQKARVFFTEFIFRLVKYQLVKLLAFSLCIAPLPALLADSLNYLFSKKYELCYSNVRDEEKCFITLATANTAETS